MKLSRKLLAVAVLATLSLPAQAEITFDVIGPYEVSFEGLFQADGNWYDEDVADLGDPADLNGEDHEFELRRAEVIVKGKGVTFDWVVGYDAKADKFLDTNLRWKLGTSYLMAGQYKQPNSMEELSSTRFNDFISKAMVTNLFGVARRTGIAYGRSEPNWGYQVSMFDRELTRNLAHGSGYGGRGWWLPYNEAGSWAHVGLSYLDYDTDMDTVRLRVRPDADLTTARLLDTGNIRNADSQRTVGIEGAVVQGPFKVQAEYMTSTIERYAPASNPASSSGNDFEGNSWYVSGMWNVTGETWGNKDGVPVTQLPDDPSQGMWQVGLRYDKTDLNDNPVLGGEGDNLTAGVNWYWRSNFKFSFNYVAVSSSRFSSTTRTTINDDPNIAELRLQFYW